MTRWAVGGKKFALTTRQDVNSRGHSKITVSNSPFHNCSLETTCMQNPGQRQFIVFCSEGGEAPEG
jgi:hypothetical protein